mmetsp:Transcript_32993/g.43971  ORF Transcript_32993/g.43971 Transcript_32993/m.43971 type:complete len:440 (-) Transcript_32993:168-1487(-)
MIPQPNDRQQRASAYALKPLAALSFLSGCYVIYHILVQKPEKLKRMYHRIILAMNICLLPYAITDFVGTWAMPAGTPYRLGALGNQTTCTIQGFLSIVFSFAVPYYYSSLSIYSCFAVRNSFKEESYRHIEKWIHLSAVCISLPVAVFFAAIEGINPNATVCYAAEFPPNCANDPGVPCERGGDSVSMMIKKIYALCIIFVTFVIPPMALLYLRASIKKVNRDTKGSVGKKKMIESFRKRALKDLSAQSGLYLLSFWSTHIIGYVYFSFYLITGKFSDDISILSGCCTSVQGVVLVLVYFRLEAKTANRGDVACKVHSAEVERQQGDSGNNKFTVSDIRESARCYKPRESIGSERKYSFHIFDGEADESSPWAKFLNPDDDSENDDVFSPGIEEDLPSNINNNDAVLNINPDDDSGNDIENAVTSSPGVEEDLPSNINV